MQKALQSPFVLAIVPALLLLYFLPLKLEKYTLTLIENIKNADDNFRYAVGYYDLDHDGTTERIEFGKLANADSSYRYIHIFKQSDRFIDQWNFKGDILKYTSLCYYDSNDDGNQEVFFFSKIKDSLFLNRLDPFIPRKKGIQRIFVDTIAAFRHTYDVGIKTIGFEEDQVKQQTTFTFGVYGGYARQPRRFYRYLLGSNTFEKSEVAGMNLIVDRDVIRFDFDGDGKTEYLVPTAGTKNYSENYQDENINYLDTCAYVLAYNDDLTYLFDPIPVQAYGFLPGFIEDKGEPLFYYVDLMGNDWQPTVLIRDSNGQLKGQFPLRKQYATEVNNAITALAGGGFDNIIIAHELSVNFYTLEGNLTRSLPVDGINFSQQYAVDLLDDRANEYVFMTKSGLWIVDDAFEHPVFISINDPLGEASHLSVMKKSGKSAVICFNNGYRNLLIHYSENEAYKWRYFVWLGIYLAMTALLWLAQFLQKRQLHQKFETERRLMTFRLKALKNQSDPHFIMNALNSIANMQEQGQQENASSFLVKFSRLIHQTLVNSDKIDVSLEEELSFVRDYLDVQQMRFSNDFGYNISVEEEGLSELSIPRHLIYTFVENALKHGISQKKGKGHINIAAKQEVGQALITISDNGIGRQEAAKLGTAGTGKGLKIIDELIELFEKLKKVKISYQIEDIYGDDRIAIGTQVNIRIPLKHES